MRGRSRARMLQEYPNCIFCGGVKPATTEEHMPPRVIFDGKDRPKGLEFPCCEECQQKSRMAETIVAMFSRIYPDPEVALHQQDIKDLLRAVANNVPGLLEEIYTDQLPVLYRMGADAFKLPSWNFINVGGPIANKAFEIVGFKLGLALDFDLMKRTVPKGGGVIVFRYSNADAFTGDLPYDIQEHLGPGRTLRMGKKSVENQFQYQSALVDDGVITAHFAVFRESFALLMVVYSDPAMPPLEPWKDDIMLVT